MAPTSFPLHPVAYIENTAKNSSLAGWLTEHNRAPVSLDNEIIETRKRTIQGTLRSYVVASKKSFNISWSGVPASKLHTVDGFNGGKDMHDFYTSFYNQPVLFYIASREIAVKPDGWTAGDLRNFLDNTAEKYTVRFKSFNHSIVKRGVRMESNQSMTDFWDVDMSLEEV